MSTPTTSTLSSVTTSCCENGRPIMTDPHTGQTVCSCQYGSGLLSAYSRVPSLTDSVYSAGPYGSQSYMPLGTDPSAFYSPLVSIYIYIYFAFTYQLLFVPWSKRPGLIIQVGFFSLDILFDFSIRELGTFLPTFSWSSYPRRLLNKSVNRGSARPHDLQ